MQSDSIARRPPEVLHRRQDIATKIQESPAKLKLRGEVSDLVNALNLSHEKAHEEMAIQHTSFAETAQRFQREARDVTTAEVKDAEHKLQIKLSMQLDERLRQSTSTEEQKLAEMMSHADNQFKALQQSESQAIGFKQKCNICCTHGDFH